MKREFVATPIFDRYWNALGLSDEDLREFQNFMMRNSGTGNIIEGTGGAAKIRYALPGKGKRGGVRVIFADITHKERVYLLLCYAKSEQDNLTSTQKQQLKSLIKTLKGEYL